MTSWVTNAHSALNIALLTIVPILPVYHIYMNMYISLHTNMPSIDVTVVKFTYMCLCTCSINLGLSHALKYLANLL